MRTTQQKKSQMSHQPTELGDHFEFIWTGRSPIFGTYPFLRIENTHDWTSPGPLSSDLSYIGGG